jgi:hypothetical protein
VLHDAVRDLLSNNLKLATRLYEPRLPPRRGRGRRGHAPASDGERAEAASEGDLRGEDGPGQAGSDRQDARDVRGAGGGSLAPAGGLVVTKEALSEWFASKTSGKGLLKDSLAL